MFATRRHLLKRAGLLGAAVVLGPRALFNPPAASAQADPFLSYLSSALNDVAWILANPGYLLDKPSSPYSLATQLRLLRADQENLRWLLARGLPITIVGQPDPPFPAQKVIEFARVFRAIDTHIGLA